MVETISKTSLLAVLERAEQKDRLGGLVREALVLIETVLSGLGEEAVAMSFNGGKDCTVLLHIYAAVLFARHMSSKPTLTHLPRPDPSIVIPSPYSAGSSNQPIVAVAQSSSNAPDQPIISPPPLENSLDSQQSADSKSGSNSRLNPLMPNGDSASSSSSIPSSSSSSSPSLPYPDIRSIYITAPNPFPELDGFVLDCTKRYKMDLYRFGGGMKAALTEWLGCGGGRGVRGVLVGTRKGDPNDNVEILAPTDPSWPQFLRVHPILHWTYADVWNFLLELNVPYCTLYDEGYTSLGSTTNTSPNPLLRNSASSTGWDPAYKLQDASQERAGRH
ncbi:hypothetical protein IAU59_001021 [Kwoniella sp. CBS 9459]